MFYDLFRCENTHKNACIVNRFALLVTIQTNSKPENMSKPSTPKSIAECMAKFRAKRQDKCESERTSFYRILCNKCKKPLAFSARNACKIHVLKCWKICRYGCTVPGCNYTSYTTAPGWHWKKGTEHCPMPLFTKQEETSQLQAVFPDMKNAIHVIARDEYSLIKKNGPPVREHEDSKKVKEKKSQSSKGDNSSTSSSDDAQSPILTMSNLDDCDSTLSALIINVAEAMENTINDFEDLKCGEEFVDQFVSVSPVDLQMDLKEDQDTAKIATVEETAIVEETVIEEAVIEEAVIEEVSTLLKNKKNKSGTLARLGIRRRVGKTGFSKKKKPIKA